MVSHFDFRVIDFKILEPVDSESFSEDVIGAKENDVEFLQVAVFFAPAQCLAVAHGLVETCAFGNFLGVLHLHFDIETAEGFTIGAGFFYENIEADALANGIDLNCLFWFGFTEFVNLDAENCFEEGLGDFLVAKYHRKHKLVGDGQLFKGGMF